MDDRVWKMIFVGYSEQIKGYKVFDLFSRWVIFIKSVFFDEYIVLSYDLEKELSSEEVRVDRGNIEAEEDFTNEEFFILE